MHILYDLEPKSLKWRKIRKLYVGVILVMAALLTY